MHHIYNIDMLRTAYLELKRNAAPVSIERRGILWRELEKNLQNLSERLKSGAYRAKPVRIEEL